MFRKVFFSAAFVLSLAGCASVKPPIQTEAALGKVVVYRNGVAYFERRAVVSDGQLKLTVPVERVDDFLKSLKVVDARTGESLPVSFKTMEASSSETEMVITVPGKTPRELLVTYVTESPAWKPSYRIVLGKEPGKAELEAWAVVDNVSGEDWKRVTVGVGSTSALSFRYDLHSVREVERQTLGDEAVVALAPPIGGSPYAVASKEVPVVAVVAAVYGRAVDARSAGGRNAGVVRRTSPGTKTRGEAGVRCRRADRRRGGPRGAGRHGRADAWRRRRARSPRGPGKAAGRKGAPRGLRAVQGSKQGRGGAEAREHRARRPHRARRIRGQARRRRHRRDQRRAGGPRRGQRCGGRSRTTEIRPRRERHRPHRQRPVRDRCPDDDRERPLGDGEPGQGRGQSREGVLLRSALVARLEGVRVPGGARREPHRRHARQRAVHRLRRWSVPR